MWVRNINTLKARNILLNKMSTFVNGVAGVAISKNAFSGVMTTADWNTVLTLTSNGVKSTDYVLTGRTSDINNWFGIFAPPQTPKPIVDRIYLAITKALANPELSKKFSEEGFDIVATPPDRFEKSFKQEITYWQKFAKDNKLKID
jgi:hypothetical protein